MRIGQTSIHCVHDSLTARETVALAKRVEAAGYGALWIAETFGREVFAHAAHLLDNTDTLVVGMGIANIYARDPKAMVAGQLALAEQSGGRFLLGVGVSHALIVSEMRGHDYGKPIATMRKYLETMTAGAAVYQAPMPAERPKTILAALRPKMLELAGTLADGAIPTWVPPEHSARAREVLGPDKLLCPLQYVMLETDPAKARAAARVHCGLSMSLPNYQENLKWLGFTSEDFENGGSDRLVDAIIAWGDEAAIRARIQAHLDAGADHVCIGPLSAEPRAMMDINPKIVDLLAPEP
jgi:probable F420-dependent oxidoreductase